MADVRLSIAGREYIVTCKDGEEDRLNALGKLVDAKAREAGGSAGGLNESRLLLFASLLLADQVYDAQPEAATATAPSFGVGNGAQMAEALERLAERIEKLVQGLEDQA
jgi:cell division protein ZapA